jgi:integrase
VHERLDIIDSPRTYRDELPPRALAWNLVLKLLRSIDRSDPLGCRDHAMLYLMAYYGLRPSEVVTLMLTSIDWANQTLRVEQCKTRSLLVLPLSNQTLRVLKRYLRWDVRVALIRSSSCVAARPPARSSTRLCAISMRNAPG